MGLFNEHSLFERLVRLGRVFFKPSPKCHVLYSRPRAHLQVTSLEDRIVPQASWSEEFITQVYTDLLHRAVDSGGLSFWSGAIDQGQSPGEVVLAIESSAEYKTDEVSQIYQTYLNRTPDLASWNFWVGQLGTQSVEQVTASIIGSAEFFQDAGGTNEDFLKLLYKDALDRSLDPSGEAYYGGQLDAGVSRVDVADEILTSNEYRVDLVNSDYEQFFHQPADPSGMTFWVGQLDGGASDQAVIAGIMSSTEYETFVPAAPVITSPSSATTTTSSTYTITGTAENGTLVQILSNGTVVGSEQLVGSQTNFSISVPLTTGAIDKLEANVTNAYGNVSPETAVPPITQETGIVDITTPSEQENHEGDIVSLQITATDSKDKTLTYTAQGLPAGLSISSTTGLISGTISTGTAVDSPYTVTVTASDGTFQSSAKFTWLVDNESDPVVTAPADQTNYVGDVVSGVKATATFINKNPLTYTATGLPTGLTMNSKTGEITGTIATTDASTTPYTVTVSVTDGLQTGTATFKWTVNPVVTVTPPANQTDTEGDTVSGVTVTATDAKDKTLTYSAQDLPAGLSINSSTGAITGTIAAGAGSATPYTVTVTASDGTYSGSATFTWTVNPAITITPPTAQTDLQGTVVSGVDVTATDFYNKTLSYTATNLPSGLTINSSTGVISGTIADNAATSTPYTVTVTASDGTYSSSATFTWTVTPVVTVTPPAAQTDLQGTTISDVDVSATDANNATLSYTAGNLPPGLMINSMTGVISGTITDTALTTTPYTVTITATDGTFSGTATFTWTVTPVITVTPPAEQLNHEGDVISDVTVTATDAHNGTLNFTATNLPAGLSINPTTGVISGTIGSTSAGDSPYTVTVVVGDGTYSTTATFTWLVDSTADPVVNAPATQLNVDGDTVSGVQVTATEGNNNPLTFTATGLPSGLTINSTTGVISGTIASGDSTNSPYTTVTVTATDGLNSGSATFTWVVTQTAPSSTPLPFSLTDPAWEALPSGVRIWDVTTGTGAEAEAGDTITVTFTGYLTNGTIFNPTTTSFQATLNSSVIEGWVDGLAGMKVGGERRLDIPSSLGYATSPPTGSNIPTNSELVFDVTLTAVTS